MSFITLCDNKPNSCNLSLSSSKKLNEYIGDYEMKQVASLADSMTAICTETPLKRKNVSFDGSSLGEEIKMAKILLPHNNQTRINGSVFIHESVEDLLSNDQQDASPLRSTSSTSQWFSSPPSPEYPSSKSRRRKKRHAKEEKLPEEVTTFDSADLTLESLESQSEDLERTLRLVNDLKADHASMTTGLASSYLPSLIERLTATAERKATKLFNQSISTVGSTSSRKLHIQDLDESESTRSFAQDSHRHSGHLNRMHGSWSGYIDSSRHPPYVTSSSRILGKSINDNQAITSSPPDSTIWGFETPTEERNFMSKPSGQTKSLDSLREMISTLETLGSENTDRFNDDVGYEEGNSALGKALSHLRNVEEILQKK